MKKIHLTALLSFVCILLAFYGPAVVRELVKEAEQGGTEYSKIMNIEQDGRSITIFKDVTLSQRQIDSLKKIGKIE